MSRQTVRKHSPEARAEVCRLYRDEGLTTPEIGKRLGIPANSVYIILKEEGAHDGKKRRRPYQPGKTFIRWKDRPNREAVEAAIFAEYPTVGPKPIAERFDIPIGTISCKASQLGVKCITGIERRKATFAANNPINIGFFETWSANLAWLLGYVWADGSVYSAKTCHKLAFRCSAKDESILHDIRRVTGCKSAWRRTAAMPVFKLRGKPAMAGEVVGFTINSQAVVRRFIDVFGIPPNKSNTDPDFPRIPDEWLPHFTRGVIDGDGSISKNRLGFTKVHIWGSHKFIESLRYRIAIATGLEASTRTRHTQSLSISQIQWGAVTDVVTLLKWLYPPGEYLSLARKRETALAYLQNPPLHRSRPGKMGRRKEASQQLATSDGHQSRDATECLILSNPGDV